MRPLVPFPAPYGRCLNTPFRFPDNDAEKGRFYGLFAFRPAAMPFRVLV